MRRRSIGRMLSLAMLGATLALGCQLPQQPKLSQPRVLVHIGSLKFEQDADLAIVLRFQKGDFSAQSLASTGVHRVQVTVTSQNLATPLTQEVTQEQFEAGIAVFNFTSIPPGDVTVKVNAFDANGKLIQWTTGQTTITPGQTQVLNLYCNTATGNLKVVYDCPDCPTPAPSPMPTPVPTPGFATSSLLVAGLKYHSSEVIGDKLYVIGGHNGSSYLNSISVAQVLNGTIASFSVVPTTLTGARGYHTSIIIGDSLYIIGGYNGSWGNSTIERATINSDGTIGAFAIATDSLSVGRGDHAMASNGQFLYILGGYNGGFTTTVEMFPIRSDGALGPRTTVSSLANGREAFAATIIGNYLYIFGGFSGDGGPHTFGDIQRATINSDGTLSAFTTMYETLSTPRHGHRLFIKDGFVYLAGGMNYPTYLSSIERAKINPDNTLGGFSPLASASLQIARTFHSSTLFGNFLYVTGGENGTTLNSTEVSAF